MNTTGDLVRGRNRFLPRFSQYSLGVGLALAIVCLVLAGMDTDAKEPCGASLPLGVPHLWPMPVSTIVLAWVGVVSGAAALVGGLRWLMINVRHRPDAGAGWSFAGWVGFAVGAFFVLLLNFLTLYSLYSSAVGPIPDCM